MVLYLNLKSGITIGQLINLHKKGFACECSADEAEIYCYKEKKTPRTLTSHKAHI